MWSHIIFAIDSAGAVKLVDDDGIVDCNQFYSFKSDPPCIPFASLFHLKTNMLASYGCKNELLVFVKFK